MATVILTVLGQRYVLSTIIIKVEIAMRFDKACVHSFCGFTREFCAITERINRSF